jgi:hypothetical protein
VASGFSFAAFLGRWLFSAILVFGTFNPTPYCYVNWVTGSEFGPIPALATIVLLIAWIVFLRATFLAMGMLGVVLAIALFGCLAWLLIDLGAFHLDSSSAVIWLALVVASLVLATGLSWAHIRRAISGQVSVDDVED